MLTNTKKLSLRSAKAQALLGISVLALSSAFPMASTAQTISQPRLTSSIGQPLAIHATITALTPEDSQSLKVQVADRAQWDKAGLIPPVNLDSIVVRLGPGRGNPKRDIQITSPETVSNQAVDLLLTFTTASSSQVMQLSFLAGGSSMPEPSLPSYDKAPAPRAEADGSSRPSSRSKNRPEPSTSTNSSSTPYTPGEPNVVKPGDTLFGIAQNNLVPGASIYQMLLALFQANPSAFIDQNMNLVKAGATLEIPDANTVLAIDPQVARNTFAEQVKVFNTMRGRSSAAKPQLLTPGNTQSGSVQAPATKPPAPKVVEDKVSLSNQSKADAAVDARAVAEKQRQEEQARLDALRKNIEQLKEAAGATQQDSSATDAKPGSATASTATAKVEDSAPKNADAASTNEISDKKPSEFGAILDWITDNLILVGVTILGLIVICIAWAMRSAGRRNDFDVENDGVTSEVDDAVAEYFRSNKADIDLDDEPAPKVSANPVADPVSPAAPATPATPVAPDHGFNRSGGAVPTLGLGVAQRSAAAATPSNQASPTSEEITAKLSAIDLSLNSPEKKELPIARIMPTTFFSSTKTH